MIVLFLVGSLIESVFGEFLPKENRQILFQDINFLSDLDSSACDLEDSKYTNTTWCGECYTDSVQKSMYDAYKDCDPNGLRMPCYLVPDIYQDCNQPQFASIKDFKQPDENSTDSTHRLPCKEELCIIGKNALEFPTNRKTTGQRIGRVPIKDML